MRVLLVHEYYQLPGGEDEIFEATRDLLRAHGHKVTEYVRRNDDIKHYGAWDKITLGPRTTWAWDTRKDFARVLRDSRPDVAQFFNIFPLISPAVYYTCRDAGVPVIQSLDNPRLLCPAATFRRNGKVCDDCAGKTFPWPSVAHACYRDSRMQSSAVAAMVTTHSLLGTWRNAVDGYLVATDFYRRTFIKAGFPAAKMHLRPHFIEPDPGVRARDGDYALFMGRLSPEKGVATLLEAWKSLPNVPLKVRGGGPLEAGVASFAAQNPRVQIVPRLSRDEKLDLMKGARFLVWPSEGWYETFGLVAAEAFACGVPVIASRTGVAEEMVTDGQTGLHFAAGDASDLARKIEWAWSHPREMQQMGVNARADYESRFTAAQSYARLMSAFAGVTGGKLANTVSETVPVASVAQATRAPSGVESGRD